MYCRFCGKVGADTPCCIYCGTRNISDGVQKKSVTPITEPLPELQKPPSMTAVPQKPKNTIAVVGLVLCCLGYTFIFGLILSIIGLVQSKKLEGAGKKVSIAGIVIGVFYIVSCVVGVTVGLTMQSINNKNTDYINERAGYYYIQAVEYNGKSYKISDVFEGEVLTKSSIKLHIEESYWGESEYSLSGELSESGGSDWGSFSVDRNKNVFDFGFSLCDVSEIGVLKFDSCTLFVGETEIPINVKLTLKRYTEEQTENNVIRNIAGSYSLDSLVYDGKTYELNEYFVLDEQNKLYLNSYTFELEMYYDSFNICSGSLKQYIIGEHSYGYFTFDESCKNFVFNSPELTYNGEYKDGIITVYGIEVKVGSKTVKADLKLTKS